MEPWDIRILLEQEKKENVTMSLTKGVNDFWNNYL